MVFNIGSLFGDNDLNNMISRVDTIVSTLEKNKSPNVEIKDNSSNAINEFINSSREKDSDEGTLEKLLENIGIPAQRSNRYRIYDEMYSSVQLIKNIIRVYVSNILQKDVITGKSIVYIESPEFKTDSSSIKKYKKLSQSIINTFKIEKSLNEKLVHDLLRYGDHYIEIIDLLNDVANLPTSFQGSHNININDIGTGNVSNDKILTDHDEFKFISEQFEYINLRLKNNGNISESEKNTKLNDCISLFVDCLVEFNDVSSSNTDVHMHLTKSNMNLDMLYESEQSNNTIDGFEEQQLNRILLRFHSPKNMVVLTTSHNNNIIGYVEVQEHKSIEVTPGVGMQFASIIKQVSAISKNKNEDHSSLIRRIIHQMINKLIVKLKIPELNSDDKNKKAVQREYENLIHQKIGDELYFTIKRLYFESDQHKDKEKIKKINIRFIPSDRIVPLSLNPIEYSPYGTSIIDPLIYPGKLYLLSQLTNIVMKLSRAALIRKWTVETGPREQHTNLIQKLKRELRNQRITVDDITSFKSIPKILSDFKDMIILTKKGTKFVDVDIQSFGDPNIKIADLEDARRELIALSGVPAPYLGYNDVVDLREQLVHINITFATQIISIQSLINSGLGDLTDKISKILGHDEYPSKYITPALKPPVILLLQLLESTMSSIGNIQMSFQGSNIEYNPFYLLKKFVTSIDWDEFSKEAREYALFKKASMNPVEAEGGPM